MNKIRNVSSVYLFRLSNILNFDYEYLTRQRWDIFPAFFMKGIINLLVNKIYNEDCLVGLKKIPDNSIDLVVIDPPYDICTNI